MHFKYFCKARLNAEQVSKEIDSKYFSCWFKYLLCWPAFSPHRVGITWLVEP